MINFEILFSNRILPIRNFHGYSGFLLGGGILLWQVYSLDDNLNALQEEEFNINHKRNRILFSEPEEEYSLEIPKLKKVWNIIHDANKSQGKPHFIAIRDLAQLTLNNGEYHQLAQVCNIKTAVGLARMKEIDLRLFLPPPPNPISLQNVESSESLQNIIKSIPNENISDDPMVPSMTSMALKKFHIEDYGSQDLEVELVNCPKLLNRRYDEASHIELCLQVLLSRSTKQSNCQIMLNNGCLPLFVKILNEHRNDTKCKSIIGKIVANMAIFPEMHEAIFQAGFVGIFALWKSDSNLLVSLPAERALCNLDQDFTGHIYEPGIYPLIPGQTCPDSSMKLADQDDDGVDVVFVHGLLGGVFYTWRQQVDGNSDPEPIKSSEHTPCWPKDWLGHMSNNIRVIGVDFDTSLSQWANGGNSNPVNDDDDDECSKTSLAERGEVIMRKLKASGLGNKPIIFVGHSMGGLIIKEILTQAYQSPLDEDQNIVQNTKGVVFYGTPHHGSEFAKMNPYSKLLFFPTAEVQDLEGDSPKLYELNQSFIELAKTKNLRVESFSESISTPILGMDITFVSSRSSDPGIGEFYPLNVNHFNVCKPKSRKCLIFRKLHRLIWDIVDSSTPDLIEM